MKKLDVQSLHDFIEVTTQTIVSHRSELKQVEFAIQAIVSLEDALQGKGGEAIRHFYRDCHLPFIRFLLNFLDEYEDTLQKMGQNLQRLEPSPHGFIDQSFIENEVATGLHHLRSTTAELTDEANRIMSRVSDIVSLPRIDDSGVQQSIQRAYQHCDDTIDLLHQFDHEHSKMFEALNVSVSTMTKYVEQISKKFQSVDLSITSYSPKQIKDVKEHNDIRQAVNNKYQREVDSMPTLTNDDKIVNYLLSYGKAVNIDNHEALIKEFIKHQHKVNQPENDFISNRIDQAIADTSEIMSHQLERELYFYMYSVGQIAHIPQLVQLQKFAIESGFHPQTLEKISPVEQEKLLEHYEVNVFGPLEKYYFNWQNQSLFQIETGRIIVPKTDADPFGIWSDEINMDNYIEFLSLYNTEIVPANPDPDRYDNIIPIYGLYNSENKQVAVAHTTVRYTAMMYGYHPDTFEKLEPGDFLRLKDKYDWEQIFADAYELQGETFISRMNDGDPLLTVTVGDIDATYARVKLINPELTAELYSFRRFKLLATLNQVEAKLEPINFPNTEYALDLGASGHFGGIGVEAEVDEKIKVKSALITGGGMDIGLQDSDGVPLAIFPQDAKMKYDLMKYKIEVTPYWFDSLEIDNGVASRYTIMDQQTRVSVEKAITQITGTSATDLSLSEEDLYKIKHILESGYIPVTNDLIQQLHVTNID